MEIPISGEFWISTFQCLDKNNDLETVHFYNKYGLWKFQFQASFGYPHFNVWTKTMT